MDSICPLIKEWRVEELRLRKIFLIQFKINIHKL